MLTRNGEAANGKKKKEKSGKRREKETGKRNEKRASEGERETLSQLVALRSATNI